MPRKNQRQAVDKKRKRVEEPIEIEEDIMPTCPIEKDVIQVTKMVQDAVDRGYGIEGPESMLKMLKAIAPKALVDFKEDRSRWQSEMVRILGEVITSIKAKMDADVAEMTMKQATADATRAALTATAEAAGNDKLVKVEEFNKRKTYQKECSDALKLQEKTLRELSKALDVKQFALGDLEAAKASLEEVYNTHFKFLVTEPVPEPVPIVEEAAPAPEIPVEAPAEAPAAAPLEGEEAAALAELNAMPMSAAEGILETPVEAPIEAPMEQAPAPEPVVEEEPPAPEPEAPKLTRKESKKTVLKKLAELELEIGCLDTLKMILNKIPSEYSGFDKATSDYAENWMLKRIMGFTQNISEKTGAINLNNTEINAGNDNKTKAEDEKCHAIEDLQAAVAAKAAAENLVKDCTKNLKTHDQEHKEMGDRMKKAQLHLGEFSMCLMAFGRLAERSKPLPPPPAPEPAVEMEAPPMDVEMAA